MTVVDAARPIDAVPAIGSVRRSAAGSLRRGRLNKRLDKLPAVAVINALPGNGKTTLAVDWAVQRVASGDVVVWIQATEALNTAAAFTARLHADLVVSREGPRCDGHGDSSEERHGCLETMLRDRSTPTIIVVLDRFDNVDDPDVTENLCRLLLAAPRLHVVACTRSEHPLAVAAQDRGLEVDNLTARDLRADPTEISGLAAAWGYEVAPADAVALHAHTSGWIVGTKLILESGGCSSDGIGDLAASDFLRSTVFPAIRDRAALMVAMRLSLADVITPVHVRAACSPTGEIRSVRPAPALDDAVACLVRSGVLDPVAGRLGEAWSIPPLLRTALLADLMAKAPAESDRWHRAFARALREFGESGQLGLALRHARGGEDWSYLLELWDAQSIALMVGHATELALAFGRLPPAAVLRHPQLAVPAAVALAIEEHPAGVANQRAMVDAIRAASLPGDAAATGRAEAATGAPRIARASEMLLRAATVVADRLEGRFASANAGAARLNREVVDIERGGDKTVHPVRRDWALHQWARGTLLGGDERQALQMTLRAFSLASGSDSGAVAGTAAGDIALAYAVSGDAHEVEHWLSRSAEHLGSWHGNDYLLRLPAHLAAAICALDRLDPAEAHLARIQDPTGQPEMWPFIAFAMTQHAVVYGDPIVALSGIEHLAKLNAKTAGVDGTAARMLQRCRAELLLALGEANRVQRLIDDERSAAPWLRTAQARLHLNTGDHRRAVGVAGAAEWEMGSTVRERIDLLLIKAAAEQHLGEEAAADRSFGSAGALAARTGALRPYVLLAPEVLEDLISRRGNVLDAASLARIRDTRAVYPACAELVQLSDRERAVLYEMTRYQTASEIASTLFVTTSTVKKQLVSLYAKLGVHDRESAMLRAHRLGFLPEPGSTDGSEGDPSDLAASYASTQRAPFFASTFA